MSNHPEPEIRDHVGNCDCSRCQTEECCANDLCPCCLADEVERLTDLVADRDATIRKALQVNAVSAEEALIMIRHTLTRDGDA